MSLDLSPAAIEQFIAAYRLGPEESDRLRALAQALADAQKARDSLMRRIGGEIDRCILAETKLAEAHQHLATALELVDVPIGRDVEKLAAARAYSAAHPPRGTGGEP
jgi:hypothetical protein